MKYIDEFRDKDICKNLSAEISRIAHDRDMTMMEVCGTHTMAIYRYGIKGLIPPNMKLLSGPGCPVCVTTDSDIDTAIAYARKTGVIFATFGDMMRVPGSTSSLAREKSLGKDIRIVYSAADVLKIVRENPERTVIFFGIGFETTAPTVAATIKDAKDCELENLFILCRHKLVPPAIRTLLDCGEISIDGFLLPGHVCTITGTEVYNFIPENYGISCVVSGFEPADILQAIYMLAKQIMTSSPEIGNQYRRAVKKEGNQKAKLLLDEVFEPIACEWRGIGVIPGSGLRIRDTYSAFDADRIPVTIEPLRKKTGCICGEILRGVKTPLNCSLFENVCTPENPVGPCMVSSEGTCAAYYKYGR